MAAPEQKMRVVFMGTPDFAATVLRHVAAWPGCEVVAAYCQPDRPAGRGHKLQPPAVKVLAQELGIPVFQPLNFKDEADRAALAGLRPDALVVAAYGLILPQSVLDIPTIGPFNVHGSLLPQYRGAAPIQRAIMDGNHLTGITIMRMERGLDTGPMLLQRALGIGIDDTAATMHDELADLGGRLMVEVLRQYADGDPSTPKRVVWILDGYTTTNNYPYSQHESLEETMSEATGQANLLGAPEESNYVRNSVKAVVDAYDGSVRLFRWDDQDPSCVPGRRFTPAVSNPCRLSPATS